MSLCQACNLSTLPGSKFCAQCGTLLTQEEVNPCDTPFHKYLIGGLNANNIERYPYCKMCGMNLVDFVNQETPERKHVRKKKISNIYAIQQITKTPPH